MKNRKGEMGKPVPHKAFPGEIAGGDPCGRPRSCARADPTDKRNDFEKTQHKKRTTRRVVLFTEYGLPDQSADLLRNDR